MKKEMFDELVESMKEGGAMVRGEQQPARISHFPAPPRAEVWQGFAVCVVTDDPELLVPRKIYQVEVIDELVRVTDEAGEAAIYPADHFVLIDLPSEVREALAEHKLIEQ